MGNQRGPGLKKSFLPGLISGLAVLALGFLLRISFNFPFLPELAFEKLVQSIPGEVESFFIRYLGAYAKSGAFASALAINAILYGFLGILNVRLGSRMQPKSSLKEGLLYSAIPSALFLPIMLSLAVQVGHGMDVLVISTLVTILLNMIYGGLLVLANTRGAIGVRFPKLVASAQVSLSGRRGFLRKAVLIGASLAIASYFVGDFLLRSIRSPGKSTSSSISLAAITGNAEFYRVSKNAIDPVVDATNWSLRIEGAVRTPIDLTLDEIKQLPSVKKFATLQCVSNEIGGDLIGNAEWTAVRLKDVLEKAGLSPNATQIIYVGYDRYTVSVPIGRALADDSILAYEMNGVTLPFGHGFPLRAITPGLYGFVGATKWVVRIVVSEDPVRYRGFWQNRGWDLEGVVKTSSIIRSPRNGEELQGPVRIAGVASSGDRGISRVELSTDNGGTWSDTSLTDPLSENSWTLWSYEWLPPKEGRVSLRARATDKNGTVQTAVNADPFPSGATGHHIVRFSVRSNT